MSNRKCCPALIEDGDADINREVQDNYKTLIETDGLVLSAVGEEWTYYSHATAIYGDGKELHSIRILQ